ncbi:unannotated protein [freshwater metagenome]|uniref:Unannotated protein n=1 Tax=freshwater metagenome TaxID=449393 RepID=A0A6J6ET17_9ZZZZ
MLNGRKRERTFRESAGLIEADGVDSSESFNRCKFLGQNFLAGEAGSANRERNACKEDESFGDHGNKSGDRALNRRDKSIMSRQLRSD